MTAVRDNQPWHSLDRSDLTAELARLSAQYEKTKNEKLGLDLTRGKPGQDQVELASDLDGILAGNYRLKDGTDARNYGGIYGIPEARELGAQILDAKAEEVISGGNSSLTMMYQFVEAAWFFGLFSNAVSWSAESAQTKKPAKFLCPVPGYDRHFTICEALGIEMIPSPMVGQELDLNFITQAVKNDPMIKGIWCVPRFSNPSGINYSDATVKTLAELPAKAGNNFVILWDNAYAVHDLYDDGQKLAPLLKMATEAGHGDNVVMFASTSKITFAGAGISWLATSPANLERFIARHGTMAIGPDKVNQLRHARFFPDLSAVKAHMRKHAERLRPKFAVVEQRLQEDLAGLEIARWTQPRGGYFVSFDCLPGLAKKVVALTADAGVKLTGAGATWPYGQDPEDRNIRLAPSFPKLDEVKRAIAVFTLCVKLATAKKMLGDNS